MKHLKTYESYYKDPDEHIKVPFDMDDIYYEKFTSVVRFLKREFNYIDDVFKEVTDHGIDSEVIEGSTGNTYRLGNVNKIAHDLVDNGVGGQWYIENLYLSNNNIENGYQFSIGIENIGYVKGPTFDEETGWKEMKIDLTYMIYVEDPDTGKSFKFPSSMKTHKISKSELKESFKKVYDYVKVVSGLPSYLRTRL